MDSELYISCFSICITLTGKILSHIFFNFSQISFVFDLKWLIFLLIFKCYICLFSYLFHFSLLKISTQAFFSVQYLYFNIHNAFCQLLTGYVRNTCLVNFKPMLEIQKKQCDWERCHWRSKQRGIHSIASQDVYEVSSQAMEIIYLCSQLCQLGTQAKSLKTCSQLFHTRMGSGQPT